MVRMLSSGQDAEYNSAHEEHPVSLVVSRRETAKIHAIFGKNTLSTGADFPLITLGRLRQEWATLAVNSTVIRQGVITRHRVWVSLVEPSSTSTALSRTILLSQSCFRFALVLLNRDGTMSWYRIITWTTSVKGPGTQQAPNKVIGQPRWLGHAWSVFPPKVPMLGAQHWEVGLRTCSLTKGEWIPGQPHSEGINVIAVEMIPEGTACGWGCLHKTFTQDQVSQDSTRDGGEVYKGPPRLPTMAVGGGESFFIRDKAPGRVLMLQQVTLHSGTLTGLSG